MGKARVAAVALAGDGVREQFSWASVRASAHCSRLAPPLPTDQPPCKKVVTCCCLSSRTRRLPCGVTPIKPQQRGESVAGDAQPADNSPPFHHQISEIIILPFRNQLFLFSPTPSLARRHTTQPQSSPGGRGQALILGPAGDACCWRVSRAHPLRSKQATFALGGGIQKVHTKNSGGRDGVGPPFPFRTVYPPPLQPGRGEPPRPREIGTIPALSSISSPSLSITRGCNSGSLPFPQWRCFQRSRAVRHVPPPSQSGPTLSHTTSRVFTSRSFRAS